MVENSDNDRLEAENHVDQQLTFLRKRIDVLSMAGLSMEDFLFMEGMVSADINEHPLFKLYRMGMQNVQELEIHNADELRTFIQGCIIGYAAGLKATYSGDDSIEGVPV